MNVNGFLYGIVIILYKFFFFLDRIKVLFSYSDLSWVFVVSLFLYLMIIGIFKLVCWIIKVKN